jgi:hypothetical protein
VAKLSVDFGTETKRETIVQTPFGTTIERVTVVQYRDGELEADGSMDVDSAEAIGDALRELGRKYLDQPERAQLPRRAGLSMVH